MVVKNQNLSLGKVSRVAYGSDLSNAPGPLPLNLTANNRKLGEGLEMRLERGVGLGTKLHERGCNSSAFVSAVCWGSTG